MSKEFKETLKKLQDGAAEHGATVLLEGENFRVRSEDGYSTLYEPDEKSTNLKVIERKTADGVIEPLKSESLSVDAAIKEMGDGVRRRKEEAEKKRVETEKEAAAARAASPALSAVDGNNRPISPAEAKAQAERAKIEAETTTRAVEAKTQQQHR